MFALGVVCGVGYSLFVLILAQVCGANRRYEESRERERGVGT